MEGVFLVTILHVQHDLLITYFMIINVINVSNDDNDDHDDDDDNDDYDNNTDNNNNNNNNNNNDDDAFALVPCLWTQIHVGSFLGRSSSLVLGLEWPVLLQPYVERTCWYSSTLLTPNVKGIYLHQK